MVMENASGCRNAGKKYKVSFHCLYSLLRFQKHENEFLTYKPFLFFFQGFQRFWMSEVINMEYVILMQLYRGNKSSLKWLLLLNRDLLT